MTKNRNASFIAVILAFALVFGSVGTANAADLNFSVDTTIDLSSPDIDLTIKAGSVATSMVVNTGTVVVTVSAGSAFTITSASRDLSISASGGGSVNITCDLSSNLATAVINGGSVDSTFTITPTSAQCVFTSPSGGGAPPPVPELEEEVPAEEEPAAEAPTPEITELVAVPSLPLSPTVSDIQVVIDAILTNISILQTQLAELVAQEGEAPAACAGITFTRGLTIGSEGNAVKCLQTLLNQSSDTRVASLGVGSAGNETSYFGSLTAAAVGKFQLTYGVVADSLDPGYGYVGPKTRAKINQTFGL